MKTKQNEKRLNQGQPLERIAGDCNIDFEMSAKEALEYGIVDEIVSRHFDR
ncbi:MAG: ATP-dependent Clp protease proteolytic subunit [Candidatus Ornithospirochaeta sp.]